MWHVALSCDVARRVLVGSSDVCGRMRVRFATIPKNQAKRPDYRTIFRTSLLNTMHSSGKIHDFPDRQLCSCRACSIKSLRETSYGVNLMLIAICEDTVRRNVGHETSVFSLSIHLGPHTFTEDFQELPCENSLRFSLDDYDIQLDGILGYTFFSKYNACFSYGSKSMYIDVPSNQ